MWIDFKIDAVEYEFQFTGETDSVIVDDRSNSHLLTEIKTTKSVENFQEARPGHKAQAHAYMHGLSEQYDTWVEDAVAI